MKAKTAFSNNQRIPDRYSCNGENINPPLEISDIPAKSKTIAIIADDPDAPAGTFVHWVVFDIPVSSDKLTIAEGEHVGKLGINDFSDLGYGGPCPPRGAGNHRYFFKIYTLDTTLNLREGSSKKQVEDAMRNHVLNKTEVVGLYSR